MNPITFEDVYRLSVEISDITSEKVEAAGAENFTDTFNVVQSLEMAKSIVNQYPAKSPEFICGMMLASMAVDPVLPLIKARHQIEAILGGFENETQRH